MERNKFVRLPDLGRLMAHGIAYLCHKNFLIVKSTIPFHQTILRFWNQLPLLLRAGISGFLVSTIGVSFWAADLQLIPLPWAIVAMLIPLWWYLKFFSGSGRPGQYAKIRRIRFRAVKLTSKAWAWGLAGGILFVVVVQASFVLTFRIIRMPPAFDSGYPIIDTLPVWLAWLTIIMASVVAGICEETGFRGYMQVPIENRYGSTLSILFVSVIFSLIHLTKVWAVPIIPNIFFASVLLGILAVRTNSLLPGIIGHSILDVFDYSFWWTHFSGKWERQTIFRTGPDMHFLFWCLIFFGGLGGFFWSMSKLARDPVKLGDD
jgi:membrane protease YdiL (CAAX protease family)